MVHRQGCGIETEHRSAASRLGALSHLICASVFSPEQGITHSVDLLGGMLNGLNEIKTCEALGAVPGTWSVLNISNCQICHGGGRQTSEIQHRHMVSVCTGEMGRSQGLWERKGCS